MKKNGSNKLKFEITIDPNAFIAKFEANIDGEIFIGKTKNKETASKEYHEAKEKNENAILICQPHKDTQNVFQIQTNIDSQSNILLTIQIEQYLKKEFNFFNQLNIEILRCFNKYNMKQNFDCIAFEIYIEDESGIYNVDIPMINDNDIIIDKQIMDKLNKKCEINGRIISESSTNELTIKYKINGEKNDSHILFDNKCCIFCHVISDIININDDILIPRRVMFVIDRSTSMIGSKWDKTIASTIMAIKELKNGYDRFAIILFDDNIEILPYCDIAGCILVDDKTISDSIDILQRKDIGCATNINNALLTAIEMIKTDISLLNNDSNNNNKYNFFINQIIFITDGEPNDGERNVKKIALNIKKANNLRQIDKYNDKISIFSFGIGNDGNDGEWVKDLNHSFLKLLAINNNGFYQRIKQTLADTVLSQYFTMLSKPVLFNINAKYKNNIIMDLTETRFNTLYYGNDLVICGKIKDKQNIKDNDLSLTISAFTGKQIKENDKFIVSPINISKQMKIDINPRNNIDDDAAVNNIERIWAYLKLQQFAKQQLIHNEKKEDESLPTSLALKYKFVTPWTSMIVVKKKCESIQLTPISSISNNQPITPSLNENQVDHVKYAENMIAPPPSSKKKKKKKKKKKNKGLTKDGDDIKLTAEISERIDCLLNCSGEVVKQQIVGTLSLKYDEMITEEKYFYGTILNLENTKLKNKMFKHVDRCPNSRIIRVKLPRHKKKKEKKIGILKYICNARYVEDIKERKEILPFSVELRRENRYYAVEQKHVFVVECIVKRNNDSFDLMKGFSITGYSEYYLLQCHQYTESNIFDFVCSQDHFIWSLKKQCDSTDIESNTNFFIKDIAVKDKYLVFGYIRTDDLNDLYVPPSIINYCILYLFGIKQYRLISKFASFTANDDEVELTVKFEMDNICVSSIQIISNNDYIDKNNGTIIKTVRNMHSGQFVVRPMFHHHGITSF